MQYTSTNGGRVGYGQDGSAYSPTWSVKYGYNAAALNAVGQRNVTVGMYAADLTRVGDDNVVVGAGSARSMRGGRNTVLGAGSGAESGSNNVVVGASCTVVGTGAGNVLVGAGGVVAASNCVALAGSVVDDDAVVIGNRSHRSVALAGNLVTANGDVCVVGSASLQAASVRVGGNWSVTVDPDSAALVFGSSNGHRVYFDDVFEPGVLNFTGQHRCVFRADEEPVPGCIVRSTGAYRNLDGGTEPTPDEAIPVVEPTTTARDAAVFGVVSGVMRGFRVGYIGFGGDELDGVRRVVVNSVGEGGMLVCPEGGDLSNGDLIESSGRPGLGRRQADDVVRSSTVAKITCDCSFEPGETSRFVGCVFKM